MKIIFILLLMTGVSVAVDVYDGHLINKAYAEKDQHKNENNREQEKHDHEDKDKGHKHDSDDHDNHKRHNKKNGHDHNDEGKQHKHDEDHDSHENDDHTSYKDDHDVDNNITKNTGIENEVCLAANQVSSERLIQSVILDNLRTMSNKIGNQG